MLHRIIAAAFLLAISRSALAAPDTQPATRPAADLPAASPSRVVAVTVYQDDALVTRQVQVKEGMGLMELVVRPLPPQTIDSSLYTEASDGIRVLTTRFRTQAVQQDTRAEVRGKEDQIHQLTARNTELSKQLEVAGQNVAMMAKLENFTSATLATLSEKGLLNAENTIKLATYVMETRGTLGKSQVQLQQEIEGNTQSIQFLERQMKELSAGADRTEREAVIVVDKANAAVGTVRLNYLVSSCTWHPQYKLRAGAEKEPVTVEYLAAIEQQSGEDWTGVDLVLSTAQPMLNAAPPVLLSLDVDVTALATRNFASQQNPQAVLNKLQNYEQAKQLRAQAQREMRDNNNDFAGNISLNSAAASEQYADLLAKEEPGEQAGPVREGPSVAYHLVDKLTVPSRADQQFVEIARIEFEPTYYYKTVPVLSQHVYRLADLTNKSKYVLLPGEATMYVGTDFVGRMTLPLVAIGEQFVAGFGVDPQIQVDRQLVAKNHAVQGGNQVQTFDYRIRVSSFKSSDVTLQVWDRLPHAETEAVAVELVKTTPEFSADGNYVRAERPKNLLRWDMPIKANTTNANAATIEYEFKLQYAKDVAIGNFKSTK